MQTIDLEIWEEFEEQLKVRNVRNISTGGQIRFRGQGNSCWPLDTTLERKELRGMPFADYYRLISVVRPQIETFTETKWGTLPKYDEVAKLAREYDDFSLMLDGSTPFPAYGYMAYLPDSTDSQPHAF